ncbi:MAG: DUF1552 domain-containing protein [Polyangiaceae bacterium]
MTRRPQSSRLNRRNFLRAAGVCIGLPTLLSLDGKRADANAPPGTKRFVALFFPNGTTMHQDWQLSGSGTNYTRGSAHDALLVHQPKLSMFTGLNGTQGGAPDHSRGTAEFLTGAAISDKDNPQVAISIDQAIADAIDPPTAIRSLHLGPTPYPSGPPSDTGWASGYNTYISWSSSTAPNPPLESAQVAFDQLFVTGGDPTMAEKRMRLRQSILDHTIDQIGAIEPKLGASDKQKLDEYLTAVREVEKGLQNGQPTGCGAGTAPPDAGLSFADHTKAMMDIVALALQCDATRIITYCLDYGFGNKDFTFLGNGSVKHHNLSHSGTAPNVVNAHLAIVKWYMDQFAYLLTALDAVDEGGATLLDNSVVYLGSDVGNGWSHSHQNLPNMLAGGGAGALNPGRLIDAGGASYDSVLLALAHAMDAPLPSFSGESTPFGNL